MATMAGLMLVLVVAVSLATQSYQRVLCGRELADTLDLVCAGRGFHWNKRSVDNQDGSRPRRSALGTEPGTGPTRSVVDECCRRPCGYNTLNSYCATDGNGGSLSGFNLWDAFSGGRRVTTTATTSFTTTPPTGHYDPNSPSAEVIKGPPRHGNTPTWFYVQLGELVTRNPLIRQ